MMQPFHDLSGRWYVHEHYLVPPMGESFDGYMGASCGCELLSSGSNLRSFSRHLSTTVLVASHRATGETDISPGGVVRDSNRCLGSFHASTRRQFATSPTNRNWYARIRSPHT